MSFILSKYARAVRIISMATLAFIVCWGLVLVLAQIKPFWIDEWRLIYNLKFKDARALWGPLEYTQQFPRTYLEVVKAFTWLFDYSYITMRLPSFVVSLCTIWLCYRLMNRIYGKNSVAGFLFIFILLSSFTFTEYFVQVKHYTMELFLCLVAIWQLLEIIEIPAKGIANKKRYFLLCASLLIAPFFSYTYPIAAVPIFATVILQAIVSPALRNNYRTLAQQWLPLLILAGSILAFYKVDVSRVMGDGQMNGFWSYRMITGCHNMAQVAAKIWDFFAEVGAGLFFEIIFGALGIAAFIYCIAKATSAVRNRSLDSSALLKVYAVSLVLLSILLFFAGKLPIEPKFNAFATPSIAILIISLLHRVYAATNYRMFALGLSALIFVGLIGNVFTTALEPMMSPTYAKRVSIYIATENAILQAQANKLPIIVTPGVAYPDAITKETPNLSTIPAGSVLKTFPAYKVDKQLQVISLNTLADVGNYIRKLPPSVKSVMVGDGISYKVINRQ